jgi:hypothetical protein
MVHSVCHGNTYSDIPFPLQLTFNNLPLVVHGASDVKLSFHVGAVALVSRETQDSFERCIRAADDMVCCH